MRQQTTTHNYKDMKLDIGRKFDLDELHEEWKKSPHRWERQEIEKKMSEIIHQTGASRELRDKLIQAVRNGDERARKYFENKLILLKQEKENGRQW